MHISTKVQKLHISTKIKLIEFPIAHISHINFCTIPYHKSQDLSIEKITKNAEQRPSTELLSFQNATANKFHKIPRFFFFI